MFEGCEHLRHLVERLHALAGGREVGAGEALVEDEVHEGLGAVEISLQLGGRMGGEELHRVLVVGQDHAHERRRGLVDELDGTLRGTLTCGVAVEHADDPRDALALEELDVIGRERRPEGGDGVGVTVLVHRDDVGVPLADDGGSRRDHRLLGAVVGKEVLALVEGDRVARVDVLAGVDRLALGEHAPAEGDGASPLVVDGEHHALEEPVRGAPVALHGEVAGVHLGRREALLAQVGDEGAATGSIAQVPPPADVGTEAASGEVAPSGLGVWSPPPHEHRRVERLGLGEAVEQAVPLRSPARALLLGELDSRTLRERADGVGKLEVVTLHDVGEDVAALPAAKAVPEARVGVDLERRSLLAVEGAAAPELAAALPKLDRLAHQRDDVRRLAHPLLVLVGDHRTPPTPDSPRFFLVQSMLARTADTNASGEENFCGARRKRTKTTSATSP